MKLSTNYIVVAIFLLGVLQACNKDNDVTADQDNQEVGNSDFDTNSQDITISNAVIVTFDGTMAIVENPFENSGVTVEVSKGDVVVTATVTDLEVNYVLSGVTTTGSFKLYSDYKFGLILNGVSIGNADGPAINIQSGKKASVTIVDGTNNQLIDGTSYDTSDEDQKGTFFSEGQLVFDGNGNLSVSANYKHAIVSDDYIALKNGNITIVTAVSDGVHANDYVEMEGGTLTITSSGDGVDVEEGYVAISGGNLTITSVDDGLTASYDGTDVSIIPYVEITGGDISIKTTGDKSCAIKSEGDVTINSSGLIALTPSGKASKGIKTTGDFTLKTGEVEIACTGNSYYDTSDADIASAAGVKTDGNLTIDNGSLIITNSGSGGKGLSVDGALTINLGTLNITASGSAFTYNNNLSSEAKGIKSDGAITVNGGELSISATDDGMKSETSITVNGGSVLITKSTEGIEAPAITFTDGTISVVASDDAVNATKGNGGEGNDGSLLTISGGVLALSSTGGDPMDSNGNIVMTGGTAIVQGPSASPEVAIDYNGTFKISGGLLIASGPSGNMIQATSTSSTQNTALIRINGNVSSGTWFNVQDASSNTLITYKPLRSANYFVLSSPSLVSGSSYKVYTGGSVSGGTTVNGLNTGGAYSAGTQKGSFTISSKVTSTTL